MSFAAPHLVYLILLAPLAGVLAAVLWRRRLRADAAWAARGLWDRLLPDFSRARLALAVACVALSVLGTALALARPRYGEAREKVERRGVDVVFLLDSSLSMAAADVAPSRLFAAKAMVRRMSQAMPGDRVALVETEGEGLVLAPLTLDGAVLDLLLDTVEPGSLPRPGTELAAGLDTALGLFGPQRAKHRALVVLSDGEDHGGGLEAATARLRDNGVAVFALGIGTPQGAPIPLADGGYKHDEQGQVVITRLHEENLEPMAAATGGSYLRVSGAATDPAPLLRQIDRLEKRRLESETMNTRQERFQWPLLLAAAALLLQLAVGPFAPERRRRGAPRGRSPGSGPSRGRGPGPGPSAARLRSAAAWAAAALWLAAAVAAAVPAAATAPLTTVAATAAPSPALVATPAAAAIGLAQAVPQAPVPTAPTKAATPAASAAAPTPTAAPMKAAKVALTATAALGMAATAAPSAPAAPAAPATGGLLPQAIPPARALAALRSSLSWLQPHLPLWLERVLFNPRERTAAALAALRGQDAEAAVRRADSALHLAPDSPLTRYNAGTARLAGGAGGGKARAAEAVPLLEGAVRDAGPDLAAAASYNLGNARFASGDLAGAVEAYKQALRVTPADADAKFNLELALREQQRQRSGQRGMGGPRGGGDSPRQGDRRQTAGQGGSGAAGANPQAGKPEQRGDSQQQGRQQGQAGQSAQAAGSPGQGGVPAYSQRPLSGYQDQPEMSAGEATAVLEAVQNLERQQRRLVAARQARQRAAGGVDW
jgi:Ca-activated chloride channel family protein